MNLSRLASRGQAAALAARHVNTLPKTPANFAALTPLDFLPLNGLLFLQVAIVVVFWTGIFVASRSARWRRSSNDACRDWVEEEECCTRWL